MVKAFVSYSWDNEDHKIWVCELATCLRNDGVDVILDQWHTTPGDQLPEFMERAVRESDYVLIVCTHKYKERSDNRQGGVGYEGDIMSAEVFTTRNQRKFIPILRQKKPKNSLPNWLSGKYYIDLSDSPYKQRHYDDLITTLLGIRESAPAIGKYRRSGHSLIDQSTDSDRKLKSVFQNINLVGVIVDEVGVPRNDGTKGSALYKIPFQLSQRPSQKWADLFRSNWDHPSMYSTMHRPGIASVVGDKIVLDGTTIEEVMSYHRDTLILVLEATNETYKKFLASKMKASELEEKKLNKHRNKIEDLSKQIRFEDE